MAGVATVHPELIGVVPLTRITIGRTEQHGNLGAHRYRLATDHHPLVKDPTLKELQWGIEAQQLFHRGGGPYGSVYQQSPLIRLVEQCIDPVAHGVHGGLMASVQQYDDRTYDFVIRQSVPIVLRGHQARHQTLVGVGPTPRDMCAYELHELFSCLRSSEALGIGSGELVHLDDVVRPLQQTGLFRCRNSQQLTNHGHRIGLGIVGQQVKGVTLSGGGQ